MKLGLIVEGHGDVQAVQILARRVLGEVGVAPVEIPEPLRLPRGKMVNEDELGRAVELMARKTNPHGALLIVLDADDDCPASLGPKLVNIARQRRSDRRIGVVVAKREFEAWFVAAAPSLAGFRGLPLNLAVPASVEEIRNAKGWLGDRMPNGYSETLDQPAFADKFDLTAATTAPSFAKFRRELERLAAG